MLSDPDGIKCSSICKWRGLKSTGCRKGPQHKRGGNSFFTDGAIRFAYNDLDGLSKVVDNLSEEELNSIELPKYAVEDYHGDLMDVTKTRVIEPGFEHLTGKSYETILWMKEQVSDSS